MECIIISLVLVTRTLVACGMPKIHKGKRNISSCRLVVTVVGSPFHCISRWLDTNLRELLDQMPSHVNNSNDIVLIIQSLNKLDGKIFLFTADDTSMYPNINTEEGL